MEYHVYRVYVAQTDAVCEELEFLGFDEFDFFEEIIKKIADGVVHDVHGGIIDECYLDIIGGLCVAYFAHAIGSEIYINIFFVDGNGDWDPDDGVGLDHLAHAPAINVVKGFASLIGGQVVFRWIKKPKRRGSSFIESSEGGLPKAILDRSMTTAREALIETQNVELESPPISIRKTIQRYTRAKTNEYPPIDMDMSFSACGYSLQRQTKADWRKNIESAFLRDFFNVMERREKMTKNPYSDSFIEMPLGCSLPRGCNSMEHLNSIVHGPNFAGTWTPWCPVPDHGNPGAN